MKNFCIGLFLLVMIFSPASEACTTQTINETVSTVDPYREHQVESNFDNALKNLSLCDENLFYAGKKLGKSFDPYREISTYVMSNVVIRNASTINNELAYGLGLGLINELDLYRHSSTIYMLRSIVQLAKVNTQNAKEYAIETLKKSDPYREKTNRELLKAVEILRELAKPSPTEPQAPTSIWSFRSEERTCKTIPGPWGDYYPCPKYTASVKD
ncbi:MAG: hypothetical protein V4596_07390 [Bdellovibrionota bacterium]